MRLLPRLLERFRLGDLVTTYPLEDHATAMRDVANGSVMKAVFVSKANDEQRSLSVRNLAADGERSTGVPHEGNARVTPVWA